MLVLGSILGATSALTVIPQLFQLQGESDVSNVKLWWTTIPGASHYVVTEDDGGSVANVTGDSTDLYGIKQNTKISVSAYSGTSAIETSGDIQLSPYTPSGEWSSYSNSKPSELKTKSQFKAGSTYYTYAQEQQESGKPYLVSETSSDGYNFGNKTTVLDSDTLCQSTGGTCNVERADFLWNPTTQRVVFWGHYEDAQNYDKAEVVVADAELGGNFTYHWAARPLGYDSRDFTVFPDGDSAYLISATQVNTNMNIYNLTGNWTNVDSLVTTVYKKEYREAPSMIKENGTYFLFTSRASGWYPSVPKYITANSIKGPWTQSEIIGNTATFCSQSGTVRQVGNQYVMLPDRYSANWDPAQPPNRELALPISIEGDKATFNFYPTVKYQDGQGVYGLQTGKILSQGKNVTGSSGSNIQQAVAGTQDNESLAYQPDSVPFFLEVDLGESHQLSQIDLTTSMIQGSEAYYQYNVTGSSDRSSYQLLVDKSGNEDVGFSTSLVNSTDTYRYVRLAVDSVVNTHNQQSVDWSLGVELFQVYGS